jgi:glycosyltransferase involved in cell wall biosynthesis
MTKKILILCNDFPPINSIGADRPYSWYLYFKEFGLYPIVITKNWITDGNDSMPIIGNVTIHEKTEFGEVIRVRNRHIPSTKFSTKFGNRFKIIRKALSFLEITFGYYIPWLDRHKSVYYEAKKYLKKNKVDLILATGEPFILFQYCKKLKNKFGIKWIADYRDGWYLNHIRTHQKDIFNQFIKNWELIIEKKIVKDANLIVTVDPEMASRLSSLLQKKVEVIYNGFWDFHEENHINRKDNKLIINHTGTLTPGQQLELFLDALKELFEENKISKNNFQFNLIGLEYFPNQMKRLLPYKNMINEIVFTTPRLPKLEAIKLNGTANYLLNFTDPSLSAIYAKTFDYIASKKNILVVPGDGKLLENLVLDNNLGFILNSKEEIRSFLLNPTTILLTEKNINQFTRKKQAEEFSNIIWKLTESNN